MGMEYEGSCHCGGIAFTARGRIDQVVDCNCSLCRRRGGLLWFVGEADFSLHTPVAQLGTYLFNTRRIEHHFCPSCGIAPFSTGKGPDGSRSYAINVRCLDGLDLASLQVVAYDGAHA
jgi:hypothetical protein